MQGIHRVFRVSRLFFAVLIALQITLFTALTAPAANSTSYRLLGSYNQTQKQLVVKALNAGIVRMQDDRLRRALYAKQGLYYLSGPVVKNSNMIDTIVNRRNLLWNQLFWLSQPNSRSDTEPPFFPGIKITMTYAPDGRWVGRANLDLVKVYWNGNAKKIWNSATGRYEAKGEWQQTGEFNIQLNSAYIGRSDLNPVYGTADYWAGTIVHEMLHNLGHTHGVYGSDKNYEKYQINVFDKIIASNGYEESAVTGPYAKPIEPGEDN